MFKISDSHTFHKVLKSSFRQTIPFPIVTEDHRLRLDEATHFVELFFQEELMKIQGNVIISEALSKFAIEDALAIQRSGTIYPGDPSLTVCVLARTTKAAKDAVKYIAEQVICRLYIWEKHVLSDDYFVWKNPRIDQEYSAGFQIDSLPKSSHYNFSV